MYESYHLADALLFFKLLRLKQLGRILSISNWVIRRGGLFSRNAFVHDPSDIIAGNCFERQQENESGLSEFSLDTPLIRQRIPSLSVAACKVRVDR